MKRPAIPALAAGLCSVAIALPQPSSSASQPRALVPGSCLEFSSRAAFDSCISDATCEDFEDLDPGAGGGCAAAMPWNSTTTNLCVSPSEIEPGLEVDSPTGAGLVLGVGNATGGQPLDSTSVSGSTPFVTELHFDPPVDGVGLDIESAFAAATSVTIEVEGVSGPILTTAAGLDASAATFWGVSCDEKIVTVRVIDTLGIAPLVGSVKYGDRPPVCETTTDEAAFTARFSSLMLESFEDADPGTGVVCAPLESCLDSTSGDAGGCLVPGAIEPGLTICSTDGSLLFVLGDSVDCNDPSTTVSVATARPQSGLRLSFDPPVRRVGVSVEGCILPATWDIDVFGEGGELIESTTTDVTFAQSFWGVSCARRIESITFADQLGTEVELIDNVRFGEGCRVYTDGLAFAAAYPDLPNFEDFEDLDPGSGGSCVAPTPWDSTTGNACMIPGDIEPGITVGAPAGSAAIHGIGYLGGGQPLDSTGVVGSLGVGFDTSFSFPSDTVTVVAMQIESAFPGTPSITIDVEGASGLITSSTLVLSESAETFWAVVCDEPIEEIRVDDPGGVSPVVGSIRWGDESAAFTRICSPAVPSLNILIPSTLILETQNAAGELIGFKSSISANQPPNRLMMIVKDAPGSGNGGKGNIGYFIMGTGTSPNVPPGSAGPICVSPGLRRFRMPSNNTSATITFHDPVTGAGTTVAEEGFSDPALGAGAQSVGPANIGGVDGCRWTFQAWYRDSPGMAGISANLSDALVVDFAP